MKSYMKYIVDSDYKFQNIYNTIKSNLSKTSSKK